MALQHFNQASFDEALAAGGVLVADFWADWCGPCKMLAPVVEKLAEDYDGKAVVGKVNVDEEEELARRYGITSIPTVMFFQNGEEKARKVGVMPPEQFTGALDALL